ncbi:MAG: Crp/Fnr family transcriptional regulator [Thermoanaerobaculia bacterium]|nr:Crp/Fnr family transcriptional regulator [Thermoanaerobaculia bacterium]
MEDGELSGSGRRLALDPRFLPQLSGDARTALAEVVERRSHSAGAVLQSEGVAADRLFFVLEGQAKMCRMTPSGRNLIVSLLGPGDLFGVAAAIGGKLSTVSVVAVSDLAVMTLERDAIFELLSRQPELVPQLLPALTGHVMECGHCLIESSCSKVEVRFAQLFSDLAARHGIRRQGDVFVPVSLSRQELADMAGTTIETAIRIMSRWGRDGLVTTGKDGFAIPDLEVLQDMLMG